MSQPFPLAALLIGGFIVLVFGVLGLVLLITSLRSRQKAVESQRWPVTDGVITLRNVEVSESTDGEGATNTSYYPRVEYDYEVMGTRYHGKKIAFGATRHYNRMADAQAQLMRYPEGGTVAVHYDPNKPQDAVLEQAAPSATITLVLGVIFLVVAVLGGCGGLIFFLASFLER